MVGDFHHMFIDSRDCLEEPSGVILMSVSSKGAECVTWIVVFPTCDKSSPTRETTPPT